MDKGNDQDPNATIITPEPESDLDTLRKHLEPKYKVEDKIGSGGMADVYLGFHNLLKRKVAIKILPRLFARDEGMVGRFLQEAESAAQLEHANIITIYDIGVAGPLNYFIMAFISGGSLKDLLRKKGKLDYKAGSRYVMQICRALHYAHQKGVIHRDIKPDNIMFDEHGDAILTDFGIAKAKFASKMTATGTLIGTPHYMSPEQLKGLGVDGRSDIYSLGIMFYEILTGKLPFEGEDTYAVGLKHIQEPPVPPLQLNKKIPVALNNVILTMLAKTPEARFQSTAEVQAAISDVLAGKDTGRSAADVSEKAKKAVDTWQLEKEQIEADFQQMQNTLGEAPAAVAVAPTEVATPAPGATPPPVKSKSAKGSKIPMIAGIVAIVAIAVILTVFFVASGGGSSGGSERESRRDRDRNSGTEPVDRREAADPGGILKDYNLVYLEKGLGEINVKVARDLNATSVTILAENPDLMKGLVDISYSNESERFLIEKADGSLMTVNTFGWDPGIVFTDPKGATGGHKFSSWSEEGTAVTFVHHSSNSHQIMLVLISPFGTAEAMYSLYEDGKAFVSPIFVESEDLIIFATFSSANSESTIFFLDVDLDSGSAEPKESGLVLPGEIRGMAWTSENKTLALVVQQFGSTVIFVIHEDEETFNQIAEVDSAGYRLVFSPDGQYVLVTSVHSDGSREIISVPVDGGDYAVIVESGLTTTRLVPVSLSDLDFEDEKY